MGQLLVIYFPPLQKVFQTESLSVLGKKSIPFPLSSVLGIDDQSPNPVAEGYRTYFDLLYIDEMHMVQSLILYKVLLKFA